ncbi:MAG TPA: dienelactone hydrolase family protein [Actinomycetota bacterium]
MTPLQRYLAEEVAVDHADGLISRREALRRLALMGFSVAAASSLLAACAADTPVPTATSPVPSPSPSPAGTTPVATTAITFAGPGGRTLMGAWADASDPRGGVLVVHENRGLTDHIRSVAGRLAGSGYSALAIDLLSDEGGTAAEGDSANATAALGRVSDERFIADLKAGVSEIERRVPGRKIGAMGFCFGGGMVWTLLDAGEPRLAAAAPFYGPTPDEPDFSGSTAAVLGVYAALDDRVNATRSAAESALKQAGLTHRIETFPGANHAFFNDTGERYNAAAAAQAYQLVLQWFGEHLG